MLFAGACLSTVLVAQLQLCHAPQRFAAPLLPQSLHIKVTLTLRPAFIQPLRTRALFLSAAARRSAAVVDGTPPSTRPTKGVYLMPHWTHSWRTGTSPKRKLSSNIHCRAGKGSQNIRSNKLRVVSGCGGSCWRHSAVVAAEALSAYGNWRL